MSFGIGGVGKWADRFISPQVPSLVVLNFFCQNLPLAAAMVVFLRYLKDKSVELLPALSAKILSDHPGTITMIFCAALSLYRCRKYTVMTPEQRRTCNSTTIPIVTLFQALVVTAAITLMQREDCFSDKKITSLDQCSADRVMFFGAFSILFLFVNHMNNEAIQASARRSF